MLTRYNGVDQVKLEGVIYITNRYRNHYKRGALKVTAEAIMSKPRPWLRLLPNLNERT